MLARTPCVDSFAEVEPDGLRFEVDGQTWIYRA